jgi:hypothetical protein
MGQGRLSQAPTEWDCRRVQGGGDDHVFEVQCARSHRGRCAVYCATIAGCDSIGAAAFDHCRYRQCGFAGDDRRSQGWSGLSKPVGVPRACGLSRSRSLSRPSRLSGRCGPSRDILRGHWRILWAALRLLSLSAMRDRILWRRLSRWRCSSARWRLPQPVRLSRRWKESDPLPPRRPPQMMLMCS